MSEQALDELPVEEEHEELEDAPRRSRLRLENAKTLRRHLILLYERVRRGQLSSLEANRQAKLLCEIGALNGSIDTEMRLRRLEAHVEAQRRGRGR